MTTSSTAPVSVVLVHGGLVDGSGWQGVYQMLRNDGYDVAVVLNPTLSLDGDVAATRQIIDAQTKPVILVGHSYDSRRGRRRTGPRDGGVGSQGLDRLRDSIEEGQSRVPPSNPLGW
jgi:pimeloyl-ACP methyl ester carboxylesterase